MGTDARGGSGGDRSRTETDPLLEEARRLQRELAATEEAARLKQKYSTAGRARRFATDLHGIGIQLVAAARWLYRRVIAPVVTHRWAGAPFRGYRKLWNKVVYTLDADGDRVLSMRRAGAMVIATLVALWYTPAFLGGSLELVWDAAWMATTYRSDQVWYLGRSQEIDAENNVFSAQGCESISCTDQTSIYFRIKPSLAHHVWSFVHNRNVFFPDFVAAGIQNDVNKCHVTGYGVRWKLIVRNSDIYPQILSVACVPVTESEIEAVQPALRGADGARAADDGA